MGHNTLISIQKKASYKPLVRSLGELSMHFLTLKSQLPHNFMSCEIILQVILCIGVTGCCRRGNFTDLTFNNVENHQTMLIVKLVNTENKKDR